MKLIATTLLALVLLCCFASAMAYRPYVPTPYVPRTFSDIGYACCVPGNPNAEFCKHVRCSKPMRYLSDVAPPRRTIQRPKLNKKLVVPKRFKLARPSKKVSKESLSDMAFCYGSYCYVDGNVYY